MLYSIQAYKNTGFSPLNVPDSKTLATTSGTAVTFDSVWLLQDLALQQVKVNAQWETVQDIDYVQVNNKFYFCTGVTMENENCAVLTLELDALTTIGIDNLVINSGWCTRRHVLSDGLFENVIDEEWGPTEPPTQEVANVDVGSEDPATVLASQISLETSDLQFYCDTYQNPELTDERVSVPRLSPIPTPTKVSMAIGNVTYTKEVPTTGLYVLKYAGGDYSESLNNRVQVVRSLGLDQSIVGCYNVPGDFLTILQRPGDQSQYTLLGSSYIQKDTGLGFIWSPRAGYTVRNNKVFSGQYSKFSVVSPASGDRTDFDAHDIYNNTNTLQLGLFADIGPQGRPYCRPVNYLDLAINGINGLVGVTQGAEWQNAPIAWQLASGATVTIRQGEQRWGAMQRSLANQQKQYEDMWVLNIGQAVAGAGGAIGNLLSGGIGEAIQGTANTALQGYLGFRSIANAERDLQTSELNLRYDQFNTYAGTMFVSPEIKFPRAASLQDYVGNGFFAVHSHLSPNDTERFDRYLTMFGYRVSEILSIGCFSGRKYFNFVEANSIDITVPSGTPLRVKMRAIEQLSQGVRVWHVKPSNVYFVNNPIV